MNQPDDPEPYSIERDLEFTQLRVRALEKENAEYKKFVELIKKEQEYASSSARRPDFNAPTQLYWATKLEVFNDLLEAYDE